MKVKKRLKLTKEQPYLICFVKDIDALYGRAKECWQKLGFASQSEALAHFVEEELLKKYSSLPEC